MNFFPALLVSRPRTISLFLLASYFWLLMPSPSSAASDLSQRDQERLDVFEARLNTISSSNTPLDDKAIEPLLKIVQEMDSQESKGLASVLLARIVFNSDNFALAKKIVAEAMALEVTAAVKRSLMIVLVESLQGELAYDDAREIVNSLLLEKNINDEHRIKLLGKKAFLLAACKRSNEAFALLEESIEKFPKFEKELAADYHSAAITAKLNEGNAACFRGLDWLKTKMPFTSSQLQFLANYAHVAEATGEIEKATDARMYIIEHFPADPRIADQLLELGNYELERMNYEKAVEHYSQLLKLKILPAGDPRRSAAESNIRAAQNRLRNLPANVAIGGSANEGSWKRPVFLVANAVVICGLVIAIWFRKQRQSVK